MPQTIRAHLNEAHAPSNAQNNSDITKAEIEAKLTGEITSHTHAGGSGDMTKAVYDSDDNGVFATAQLDMAAIYLLVYPVGCIYQSVVSTSPSTLFGGTWLALGAGRILVGLDSGDTDFDTAEETGGTKTINLQHAHTLSAHTHAITTPTGAAVTGLSIGASGAGSSHNHSVTSPTGNTVTGITITVGTTAVTPTAHASQGGHTHDNHTTATKAFGTSTGNPVTGPTTHASQGAHTHDNHGLTWGPGITEPNAGAGHSHTITSPTGNESIHTHGAGSITEPNGGTGHTHTVTSPTGGPSTDSAPNQLSTTQTVMNPYLVCYRWKRTA